MYLKITQLSWLNLFTIKTDLATSRLMPLFKIQNVPIVKYSYIECSKNLEAKNLTSQSLSNVDTKTKKIMTIALYKYAKKQIMSWKPKHSLIEFLMSRSWSKRTIWKSVDVLQIKILSERETTKCQWTLPFTSVKCL